VAFDVEGARKAGYSDAEIASYLGAESKFDVGGARKSGYADSEIIAHLAAGETPPKKPSTVEKLADAVTGKSRETQDDAGAAGLGRHAGAEPAVSPARRPGLGTLLSNPQETAQIIKANFPGVQVRRTRRAISSCARR
jgi:hypothetical protein